MLTAAIHRRLKLKQERSVWQAAQETLEGKSSQSDGSYIAIHCVYLYWFMATLHDKAEHIKPCIHKKEHSVPTSAIGLHIPWSNHEYIYLMLSITTFHRYWPWRRHSRYRGDSFCGVQGEVNSSPFEYWWIYACDGGPWNYWTKYNLSLALITQVVRAFGMNPKDGGSSAPRIEPFSLSKSLTLSQEHPFVSLNLMLLPAHS